MTDTKRATRRKSDSPTSERPSDTEAALASMTDDGGQGSLEKVRDILFGASMRTYEDRLAELEQRLAEQIADAKQAAHTQGERLEESLRKELRSVADALAAETKARDAHVSDLAQELKHSTDTLAERLTQLDARLGESGDAFSARLLDQTKTLTAQLQQTAGEITARIERDVTALRGEKADRLSLATLLTEVAERLSAESPPSEGQ